MKMVQFLNILLMLKHLPKILLMNGLNETKRFGFEGKKQL